MTDEPAKKPSLGQKIIKKTVDGKPEKLASLTRKAERVLGSLRCGVNNSDDVIQSAVRTTLRNQDPTEEDPKRYPRDPPVISENQVWPLIENHLRRKLNTARAQPRQKKNQADRASDQKTEADEYLWREQFIEHRGARQHEDPELIESYIADAFATLRDLFGEDHLDQVVDEPNLKQAARLMLMGYTRREIATEMNISFHYARKACDKVVSILGNAPKDSDDDGQ